MTTQFRNIVIAIIALVAIGSGQKMSAISLNLDSIASWGKFPHLCIDVYRWGDKFFNSYDSTYVVGTGKRFNVKYRAESWMDYYGFVLENRARMAMISDPCTSMGFYLTYMAVSLGYDINVSKYFGGSAKARRRFNFGFSCSLLAADFYFISNDVGTRITKFETPDGIVHPKLDFNGINTSSWGFDAYYFFNHSHYSQGAAFSFSKIQRKSGGSPFAGFSFFTQDYNFDFSSVPQYIKNELPKSWIDYKYAVSNKNYAVRIGYAYNFALPHNWTVCFSEAPTLGIRKGFINNHEDIKTSFSLSNRFKASGVYNHGNWFVGIIGDLDAGLIYDKEHTLLNMMWSVNASVGYRFNLW